MRTLGRVCWMLGIVCWMFGAFAEGVSTRFEVISEPQGASIFIDGKDRGVSPLALFDLVPGRHHLRCRLAGYEECDWFFTLETGIPLSRQIVLEPEKGLLLVKSTPTGANILVDGVSVGTTPRLVTTLEAKDAHQVTLRKAGYRPSTFEVRFSGRTPLIRSETLVLDSGVLEVITDPAGAEVTVNGIVRGKSPVVVRDVAKGRAMVRLRMDGYEEVTRELAINAGDSQTLSVPLKGLPGTLGLTSLPPGARFYMKGEYIGKSPVTLSKLKPGDYEVRAEIEGYAPLTRMVTIGNGGSTREEFRLSNVMGRLEIRTSPAGAQVTLDGKLVGVTKAGDGASDMSAVMALENLMEGKHRLLIHCEGYGDKRRYPKIVTGETTHVDVHLDRVLVPDISVTTDSGTFKGKLLRMTPDYIYVEVSLGVTQAFPRDTCKYSFLTHEKNAAK